MTTPPTEYEPRVNDRCLVWFPPRWQGPRGATITGINEPLGTRRILEDGRTVEADVLTVNVKVNLDIVKDHEHITRSRPSAGREGSGGEMQRCYSHLVLYDPLTPAERQFEGAWAEWAPDDEDEAPDYRTAADVGREEAREAAPDEPLARQGARVVSEPYQGEPVGFPGDTDFRNPYAHDPEDPTRGAPQEPDDGVRTRLDRRSGRRRGTRP